MLVTEIDPMHQDEAEHVTATSTFPLLRMIGQYQEVKFT